MGKHETGYERVEKDCYCTPAWVTKALVEQLDVAGVRIWEPACGRGDMSEALRAAGAKVLSTDIADHGYEQLRFVHDFLAPPPAGLEIFSICTNPPYGERNKLAVRFIELGLERIGDDGFLALLLPNDFDSAAGRRHLFAECSLFHAKLVLTKRIVWFEGPGAAPKENHSWFVWQRGRPKGPPIMLYGPTP